MLTLSPASSILLRTVCGSAVKLLVSACNAVSGLARVNIVVVGVP
jgi:hypothetical protein